MKHALLACLLLVGCVGTPRAIAPLRYEPRPSAAQGTTEPRPPAPVPDPIPSFTVQETKLANGVHVVVVPRKGHGVIAVRLAFARDIADVGDTGGLRSALVAPVFLVPERPDVEASATCETIGCSVLSVGPDGSLDERLASIAALVLQPAQDSAGAGRRFAALTGLSTAFDPGASAYRNEMNALYAGTPYAAAPGPPSFGTLSELAAIRDRLLDPAAASLVVVGDVTLDAVRAAAEERLAGWQSRARTATAPPAPLAPLRPSAVVVVQNASISQVHAHFAVRAATPGTADDYALSLALDMAATSPGSPGFVRVREELGASYHVGVSRLLLTHDRQAVAVGGSFEKDKTVGGLEALLSTIRALRSGPLDARVLARSKAKVLGGWRQIMATNAGLATAIVGQIVTGQPPAPDDVAARIASVSAEDVQRVARTLLADENLRVVVVGDVRWIASDLQRLGLGAAVFRDGFGRD